MTDPSERIAYRCPRCDRTMKRPFGEVVQLVLRKKAKCQMCGADLELPAEVLAEARSVGSPAPVAKASVACPVCGGKRPNDPADRDAELVCKKCTMRFRAPSRPGGPARVGSPPRERASEDEVALALEALKRGDVEDVVRGAFLERARRGEVASGEAESIVAAVVALATWAPEDAASIVVPLAPEAAQEAIPVVVFGLTQLNVDRSGTRPEVVATLGGERRLHELPGIETLLLQRPDPAVSGYDRVPEIRVRFRIAAVRDGTKVTVSYQVDTGRPVRPGAGDERELARKVARRRHALRSYFALAALFGPAIRGAPALATTKEAVGARCDELGLDEKTRAAAERLALA